MPTLILNAKYVIDETIMNGQVDIQHIKDNYIYIVQLEVLKPALGNTFYDALLLEVASEVFTGLNETLVNDYIKPMLAFYVKASILTELRLRTTNKGIMINRSDFADSATKEEVADVITLSKEQGRDLLDEMRRYITNNSSSFSTYVSSENSTKIIGGIIIPK